jgi:hypothetical protein
MLKFSKKVQIVKICEGEYSLWMTIQNSIEHSHATAKKIKIRETIS